jgi:hypothetical protein
MKITQYICGKKTGYNVIKVGLRWLRDNTLDGVGSILDDTGLLNSIS